MTKSTRLEFALAVVTVALSLVASACAASDDAEAVNDAPSTTAATGDQTASSTSAPTSDANQIEPVTSEPSPEIEVDQTSRRLASVLADDPGPTGWLIPAGRWTTSVFAEPVTFTTPVDLVLHASFDEMLVFTDPTLPEGPQNQIVIMRSSFIHSGSERQPVPLTTEEVTATLESLPHARVEEVGEFQTESGAVQRWDMVVDDFQAGAPYACALGLRCGPVSFTRSQAAVHTLEGETTTFYRSQVGELRLASYAVGIQPGIVELRDVAGQILGSAIVADSAEPESDVSFLGTLGSRTSGVPTGTYVALLGDGLLRFDVAQDADDLSIQVAGQSTWWITSPVGTLGFVHAEHFIDPAADQSTMIDPDPEFSYIDPETIDELLAWQSGFAEVVASGTSMIGGTDVAWWESGDLRTDNLGVCDQPLADRRCATIFTVDQFPFYDQWPSEGGGRTYYADAADLLILIGFDSGTLESQFADIAPLLDGLTITPLP